MTAAANGSARTPADSGAVAVHELEVLGQREQRAEQRQERQPDRGARGREGAVAEDAHVDERVRDVQLAVDEGRDQHRADAEFAERRGGRPAPIRALDDGVDDREHCGGGQHGAESVQAGAGRRGGREGSGTTVMTATSATATSGTLTQNTEPQ